MSRDPRLAEMEIVPKTVSIVSFHNSCFEVFNFSVLTRVDFLSASRYVSADVLILFMIDDG